MESISLETLCRKLPIVNIGLIIFDLKSNKTIETTGYAQQVFGYAFEELKAQDFWKEFIHPQYHEKFLMCMRYAKHAKKGEIWHQDLEIQDKEKINKWLKMNFKIFSWNESDQPLTVAMEIMDISTLVQMEKDLREKAKALDKISYKYSHKVRGPVATILGLINLIKMEENDSSSKLIYEHLFDVVKKLDNIIYKSKKSAEKIPAL